MRLIALFSLSSRATVLAETREDLIIAPDAVLCIQPENVDIAAEPAVARHPLVLQAMRCLRLGGGIRSVLLEAMADQPWRVRIFLLAAAG